MQHLVSIKSHECPTNRAISSINYRDRYLRVRVNPIFPLITRESRVENYRKLCPIVAAKPTVVSRRVSARWEAGTFPFDALLVS